MLGEIGVNMIIVQTSLNQIIVSNTRKLKHSKLISYHYDAHAFCSGTDIVVIVSCSPLNRLLISYEGPLTAVENKGIYSLHHHFLCVHV